jgi:hypothetical protein
MVFYYFYYFYYFYFVTVFWLVDLPTPLRALCTFEQAAHPNNAKRCSFRFSNLFQTTANMFSNETLPPKLVIHGTVLDSYNDGSFYIESRSSARRNHWVKRDTYPRASIEVNQPWSVL